MKQKMDASKKYQIDEWVKSALYGKLEEVMKKRQITATDATTLTPFIQMYQAIQLEKVCDELDSLWRLLEGGDAGVYIGSIYDTLDVNIKQKPQDGPPHPRKGR